MKAFEVVLSPEARADLLDLYEWVAEQASPILAMRYVERIEDHLKGYAHAPERGHRRDDLRPGLRVAGFERRVTIAFMVVEDRVTILRLAYGGRNLEALV